MRVTSEIEVVSLDALDMLISMTNESAILKVEFHRDGENPEKWTIEEMVNTRNMGLSPIPR